MAGIDQLRASSPYLRNAWYAVAWADELGDGLLPRRVLGKALVFFRDSGGQYAALEDRCPHRQLPLSLGKVDDDTVTCRYHGLRFNAKGVCVGNPHGPIPSAAQVASYAVVERHGLLWVWMGNPAEAQDEAIPDLSFIDDEYLHAREIRGYLPTAASFTLMVDNILDLGHIEFLHPASLGSEAVRAAAVELEDAGESVIVRRRMQNEELPDFMAEEYGCVGEKVSRALTVRWEHPGNLLITVEVQAPGKPVLRNYSCHLMTPETETSTHYFWANTRLGPPDRALDERKRLGLHSVFSTEDKPVLEAQQLRLNDERDDKRPAILLRVDSGLARVRRKLEEKIQREIGA